MAPALGFTPGSDSRPELEPEPETESESEPESESESEPESEVDLDEDPESVAFSRSSKVRTSPSVAFRLPFVLREVGEDIFNERKIGNFRPLLPRSSCNGLAFRTFAGRRVKRSLLFSPLGSTTPLRQLARLPLLPPQRTTNHPVRLISVSGQLLRRIRSTWFGTCSVRSPRSMTL